MTAIKQANPLEALAYVLARQIEDHEVIYVGTGLPMVAALLAKKTHAPGITMVFESGAQDPLDGGMPWSVACPYTWRGAPIILEMAYSFGQAYNGYVNKGFLGFAQIDMYGNINTHQIGKDFLNPRTRLTGSGGNNDLSSLCNRMILVGLQNPQKFIPEVDFITSPGHLKGGNSRAEAGLIGEGPVAVVTPAAVFDFEPESRRMRVKSLHPGVSFELCQLATGFELLRPEGEIPVTEMPSHEILEIIRNDVDPNGVFTSIPGM